MMERILPSPHVTVREWDFDGAPAAIEVMLGNNTTETYIRKPPEPKQACAETLKMIQKMTDPKTGYQRKGPRESDTLHPAIKKRIHNIIYHRKEK